ISAIIGPMSSGAVKATHPLLLSMHMPQITPSATDPMLANPSTYGYLIRMAPPDSEQSEALVDFMKYFRWDTLAILTDNTDYGKYRIYAPCIGLLILGLYPRIQL
ncbi:hypothetical protein CAPTEDRAFT_92710, partial [Capitella teleta]